jgi:PAS domain-containing protein
MLVVMRVLETLGRAFTGSLVGMGLLDLDGRWLEVNPALCRLLGRDADGLPLNGVSQQIGRASWGVRV